MNRNVILRTVAVALAATSSVWLSGCAVSGGNFASTVAPIAAATGSTFSGRVHGGNQAIVGATVTLWAAGAPSTGGSYGGGATLIKSAKTQGDGSFTFNTGAVSPCTVGQYLYITATGGDTGAGKNQYSALMAALPTPCSTTLGSTTGATFVWLNEVSTVAAVWSLQQFMTISPGATVPWQIGAPSTNVTGMANAFAQTTQMANLASGTAAASAATSTVATVSYTTTITPDIARINTVADILAACVNTPGTSTCTSLFADTALGSVTPTDTIDVAFNMATSPAGLTMPAHTAANSPTYLCNQYVTASGSPFVPALTCGTNTNDWLIGVSWATNVTNQTTCGTTVAPATTTCIGTLIPASVAIDGSGNVWTGAGNGATTNFINQFSPTGAVNIAPVSTATIPAYNANLVVAGTTNTYAYAGATNYALGYARPFSLAVDTNNNAWYNGSGAASPGTLTNAGSTTYPTGIVAEVSSTGTATGYIGPAVNSAIAIDGSNNLYMNGQPVSGRYYITELLAAGGYQTLNEGVGRSTGIFNYVLVDNTSNQYAWAFNSGTACTNVALIRTNTPQEASGTVTTNVTSPSNCIYYAAPDANGNIWGTAGGNLYYENVTQSATAPTVTTVTGSTNATATGNGGTGGLDNATGVALDGNGNVWVVNRPSSSLAAGISEFSSTTVGTTTTVTALSPGGAATTNAGVFGFQADGATGGEGLAIDGSGNLWLSTTGGSFLYHMVGAAAPVVTPMALAVKNTAIATKP